MLALAARLGFVGIEVLPVRLFGPLAEADPASILAFRRRAADLGLAVPAMQGVLYGLSGVHLFRSAWERARLSAALIDVARVAGTIGASAVVFGAPGLRDPGGLSHATAFDMAAELLGAVAPTFAAEGAALCLEPVAPALGGSFACTTTEVAALVREVNHPGLRVQLDTGNLLTLGEGRAEIEAGAALAGHVHLSEPALAPVGSLGSDHAALAAGFCRVGGPAWISVEMLPSADPATALARAREVAAIYAMAEAA